MNENQKVAIPPSVAGLFGRRGSTSGACRRRPGVAIPPSVAGLFGRQTHVGSHDDVSDCRNPTFSCWAVRTAKAGAARITATSSRNPTFSCWAVRTIPKIPKYPLAEEVGRNPTFSCWAVRTVVTGQPLSSPSNESQSHLQLLGCSDQRDPDVSHDGADRAVDRRNPTFSCWAVRTKPSSHRPPKRLGRRSSQSHLQLLGCSDVEVDAINNRIWMTPSQSHLQLLGCSDEFGIPSYWEGDLLVAIPPSVAGLFGHLLYGEPPRRPFHRRNPTFSCWAVRTLFLTKRPALEVVTIGRNPTFSCWAVRTEVPETPKTTVAIPVAIPPSVAGLFGRLNREGRSDGTGKSQSHLQLLGCSDISSAGSATSRRALGRNPTFSCWAVRTANAYLSHRETPVVSQSHLQLLGCSDGTRAIEELGDCNEYLDVAIPPSVAGLFGRFYRRCSHRLPPPGVAIPPSVAGLFGRFYRRCSHRLPPPGVAIPPSVAGLFGPCQRCDPFRWRPDLDQVAIPPSVAGLFGRSELVQLTQAPRHVAIPPSVAGLFGPP